MVVDPDFWRGKGVFLTGHTGFKGSWLSLWLQEMGADVTGYSLAAPTEPSLFELACVEEGMQHYVGNVGNLAKLKQVMQDAAPKIVIHMAAQSLVRESYASPIETYATNVLGTVNLFEAVRETPSIRAVLNVTSDKCYENREWPWGYRENESLGGYDPYSSSKACAEHVTAAYRQSFLTEKGVAVASARAGNVIGGGDWAADRLIPDAIRSFTINQKLKIRNPLATRPWQHVLEPLSGYLLLCQELECDAAIAADAWNFGPNENDISSVERVVGTLVKLWGNGAAWVLDEGVHPHEARSLKLDCSKARHSLKWMPKWGLDRALAETVSWYKAWSEGSDMHAFTLEQIRCYQVEEQRA